MGFVSGGDNIAITTALPPSFGYCSVNIKWFIDILYLIYYASLTPRFLYVVSNPGPRRPVPVVCRIHCFNVRGLAGNLSDLSLSMIYCFTLRLWSQICVMCRSYWFPDLVALSCCEAAMPRARGIVPDVQDGVVVAKCWFLERVV